MKMEVWKDIQGYQGYYQVSNLGRVKSMGRKVSIGNGKTRSTKTRIMTQRRNEKGYLIVTIKCNNKTKVHRVHKLVAQSFIDNPDNLPEINHKDGNKENNLDTNLEWSTRSENCSHKVEKLRHINSFDNKPRGVYLDNKMKRYVARIEFRKRRFVIGTFLSKAEAFKAYFEKFKELRGYEPWNLEKYPTH